jgi:hypothetical protein
MNMRLIRALQDHVAPEIFADTRCVFDGRKNLYAPVELALGGDSREVRLCPALRWTFLEDLIIEFLSSMSPSPVRRPAATGRRRFIKSASRSSPPSTQSMYIAGFVRSRNLLTYHPGFFIALFKDNSPTTTRSAPR